MQEVGVYGRRKGRGERGVYVGGGGGGEEV